MVAQLVKSDQFHFDISSLDLLLYMTQFSQESSEIVWNKTFVDYGFLQMCQSNYQSTFKEFTFQELMQFLLKSEDGVGKLLKICQSLAKLNKNVASFICQGIVDNSEIINKIQLSTL